MADDLSGSTLSDRHADEDPIRELLDRQVMGWDAGDPEAYAQRVHRRRGLRHFPGQPLQGPQSDRIVLRAAVQEAPEGIAPGYRNHPTAVSEARRGADTGKCRSQQGGAAAESP